MISLGSLSGFWVSQSIWYISHTCLGSLFTTSGCPVEFIAMTDTGCLWTWVIILRPPYKLGKVACFYFHAFLKTMVLRTLLTDVLVRAIVSVLLLMDEGTEIWPTLTFTQTQTYRSITWVFILDIYTGSVISKLCVTSHGQAMKFLLMPECFWEAMEAFSRLCWALTIFACKGLRKATEANVNATTLED